MLPISDSLWLLETRIGAGLEVAEVGEDAFLPLLRMLNGTAKGLEAEEKGTDWWRRQKTETGEERQGRRCELLTNVGARDVVQRVPEHTSDVLAVR